MLYESTNCIYSAPTGRTVLVRVLKEGMANLPTVKPWNTPPYLDGEQNKIGNNTPAKSRLCEGLLRRSTHFDLGVPQVSTTVYTGMISHCLLVMYVLYCTRLV